MSGKTGKSTSGAMSRMSMSLLALVCVSVASGHMEARLVRSDPPHVPTSKEDLAEAAIARGDATRAAQVNAETLKVEEEVDADIASLEKLKNPAPHAHAQSLAQVAPARVVIDAHAGTAAVRSKLTRSKGKSPANEESVIASVEAYFARQGCDASHFTIPSTCPNDDTEDADGNSISRPGLRILGALGCGRCCLPCLYERADDTGYRGFQCNCNCPPEMGVPPTQCQVHMKIGTGPFLR